jgi:hypothetical protein
MAIEKLHSKISDVTNLAKENLHLIQNRQHDLIKLETAAGNLNQISRQFACVSKENKWRIWWKNNLRSVLLAIVLVTTFILFLLLINLIF